MYQVGRAERPEDEDATFEERGDALEHAHALSDDGFVAAVWLWTGGNAETICLVFQGIAFWP